MRKILFWSYLILLSFLAVVSIVTSWANDIYSALILEIYVDFILVFGCIIYLIGKKVNHWWIAFVSAFVGEIFLLINDKNSDVVLVIFWLVILLPAVFLNIKADKKLSDFL